MKKMILFSLVLLFAALPAAAKINLPDFEEFQLDNGLTVRVIERHSLPLFSIQMSFKAGSVLDPVGKEGQAFLCSEMLMRGTKMRTARQIAEEIAFGGGTLNNYCAREETGFGGEFLTEKGESGLKILSDLLLNSTFAEDELDKTKKRIMAGLKGELDSPRTVASNYVFTAILGDNRYAHQPDGTVGSVEGLTRADVVGFFKDYYTPDNCLLVICGDVEVGTARQWVTRYFDSWKGKAKKPPATSDFPSPTGTEILILDKPDATQTQIRIGNVGLRLTDPDYIPFEMARTIYAGSFTSRLISEIRVNRGLSYGVSCRSSRYLPGGVTYVSTFTKNESVGEVIEIILNESMRMKTEPVPDSELVGAMNYRSGLYPLNFETNDDIAEVFSNMWIYDLEESHFEDFQEKVRKVTSKQLKEMAGKYFPLDNYRMVLVGKAEEITAQVQKYGKITVKPLADL